MIAAGFRKEDVSVLLQENAGTKDFAHRKESKAPEGATAGFVVGGAIGALCGLLLGSGTVPIHGLNHLIGAGAVIAALAGFGAGAILGGIIGALVGLGTPEYEAKRYEGHVKKGGILASVHCDNREWVSKAKSVLKQTGADDIAVSTEAKADFASSDRPYSTAEPTNRRVTLGSLANSAPPSARVPERATENVPVRVAPSAPAAQSLTPTPVRVVNSSGDLGDDVDFRRHFESSSGIAGQDYSTYAPAYRYGAEAGTDSKYGRRSFEDIEPELRAEYMRRNPGRTWEQAKEMVRYGWSKTSNSDAKISGTR